MKHVLGLEVLESVDDLLAVESGLKLTQSTSLSHQLTERFVLAQLQQDVHIFFVLEEMLELHNVSMIQLFVYLNL